MGFLDDAGDVAQGMIDFGGSALGDTFSAETVNGPEKGQWGQAGTPAATYNDTATARGQALQQGAAGDARAFTNQGNGVGVRQAPTTNYAGADRYSALGDQSRNVAVDYANRGADSSGQARQLDKLNQFAEGPAGPSAAEAQLASAGDAAQRSALSMARSGRGAGESASAMRDAMFSNATTQGNIAGQTSQLRAQETATQRQQQLQALESAMGGAGAIRTGDLSAAQVAQGNRAQDQASQQQTAAEEQFKTNSQLQQTGMNDQARQGLYNTGLGYQQLGQQGEFGYAQLGQNALNSQADYELAQQQMALDAQKSNQSADLEKDSSLTGMISAGAGALFAMSDERVKKLKKQESALSGALATIGEAPGYSYKYKDTSLPGTRPGVQISSMAQDLERGPLGHRIVHDTPNGKMVNYEEVVKMTPGAITELNHKVAALEKALGKVA